MNRQQTLELLTRSKPELAARFGVTRLALFGSTARDEAHEQSDVDVLVAFDGPATSRQYFGVQFFLEDLLRTSRRSHNKARRSHNKEGLETEGPWSSRTRGIEF